MRRFIQILALTSCTAAVASPSVAQQAGSNITAEHKDVGKVQVQVQRYEHALGVTSQLGRAASSSTECNGVCYLPNSTRPVSWKCDPGSRCDLHCTVSPPVGGCN